MEYKPETYSKFPSQIIILLNSVRLLKKTIKKYCIKRDNKRKFEILNTSALIIQHCYLNVYKYY